MAFSSGKLFGFLIGVFLLVVILQLIADAIATAGNLTGIALTVVNFLPGIGAVIGLWLLVKDAGLLDN